MNNIHLSEIFKIPFDKLYDINNIKNKKLPTDIIEIIYSFCFYEINSLPYIKKISESKFYINNVIKAAFSRNNIKLQNLTHTWIDNFEYPGHWVFGFFSSAIIFSTVIEDISKYHYKENLQLKGVNCINCGEFTSLDSFQYLKTPICFCTNITHLSH